jgi:hypothetical protein
MRGAVIIMLVLAFAAAIGLFGFTEIVAPLARVAILLVPAIFMISLVVGFVSRRQTWFG